MLMQKEREQIVAYGKKMSAEGLCPGTSGNLSIFDPMTGNMAINPSGMDYFATLPEDVVVMDLSGQVIKGSRNPSSEWSLHAEFYKHKSNIRSVVHTHSPYCTTFAVLGQPIRAVHFLIGGAGVSEIPCAPYETFGTEKLARVAVRACGKSNAVLLANHGFVCCAESISGAVSLAGDCEFLAKLQYQAMCVGTPQILSDRDIAAAIERFKTYGQHVK